MEIPKGTKRRYTGWIISDNLVHKCCKFLNVKSKARHYKKANKGKECTVFANVLADNGWIKAEIRCNYCNAKKWTFQNF